MVKVQKNGKIVEVDWTPPSPKIEPSEVKIEAARRITSIAPEWKQRNMIARSVELLSIGKENWTTEQIDEQQSIELIWEMIKNIRQKSDEIEVKDPIPLDFQDDMYWT